MKEITNEINAIKEECGDKILKVIVETALLTETELKEITRLVDQSNADYIKTSTGFAKRGASIDDIKIMASTIKGATKIKASGGIKSLEDAILYIQQGADRLGTSAGVKIIEESRG